MKLCVKCCHGNDRFKGLIKVLVLTLIKWLLKIIFLQVQVHKINFSWLQVLLCKFMTNSLIINFVVYTI